MRRWWEGRAGQRSATGQRSRRAPGRWLMFVGSSGASLVLTRHSACHPAHRQKTLWGRRRSQVGLREDAFQDLDRKEWRGPELGNSSFGKKLVWYTFHPKAFLELWIISYYPPQLTLIRGLSFGILAAEKLLSSLHKIREMLENTKLQNSFLLILLSSNKIIT